MTQHKLIRIRALHQWLNLFVVEKTPYLKIMEDPRKCELAHVNGGIWTRGLGWRVLEKKKKNIRVNNLRFEDQVRDLNFLQILIFHISETLYKTHLTPPIFKKRPILHNKIHTWVSVYPFDFNHIYVRSISHTSFPCTFNSQINEIYITLN